MTENRSLTLVSLIAVSLMIYGCGSGIKPQSWSTLFFDDFNRANGPLEDGGGYFFFRADPSDSAEIVNRRLVVTPATASIPVLFFGPTKIERTRITVKIHLAASAPTNLLFSLLTHVPSRSGSLERAYACGFFVGGFGLREVINDDFVDLVDPIGFSGATDPGNWTQGDKLTLRFEVDGPKLSCSASGRVDFALRTEHSGLDGGNVALGSNRETGDVHIESLRVER